jgi:hypothetical protein
MKKLHGMAPKKFVLEIYLAVDANCFEQTPYLVILRFFSCYSCFNTVVFFFTLWEDVYLFSNSTRGLSCSAIHISIRRAELFLKSLNDLTVKEHSKEKKNAAAQIIMNIAKKEVHQK